MTSLNQGFVILSNWLYENFKFKCSFLLYSVKDKLKKDLVFNNVTIKTSAKEKVPGITFNNKLDFFTHLTSITKKANIKLNAFAEV